MSVCLKRFNTRISSRATPQQGIISFYLVWWYLYSHRSGAFTFISTLQPDVHLRHTEQTSRSIHPQSFLPVRPLSSRVFTEAIAFKCFTQGQLHRPLEGNTLMQQWSNCQNNQPGSLLHASANALCSSYCTLIKTLMALLFQVQNLQIALPSFLAVLLMKRTKVLFPGTLSTL